MSVTNCASSHLRTDKQTLNRRHAIAMGAALVGVSATNGGNVLANDSALPAPPDAYDVPPYASLAVAAQAEAARWNIPGMVAGVLHQGERTTVANGVANLEHLMPVTIDTRFQIGSITKVFTATAVMALVDQGIV